MAITTSATEAAAAAASERSSSTAIAAESTATAVSGRIKFNSRKVVWLRTGLSTAIAANRAILRKADFNQLHRAGVHKDAAARAKAATAAIVAESAVAAFRTAVRNSDAFELDTRTGCIDKENTVLIVAADGELIRSRPNDGRAEFNQRQRTLQRDRSIQTGKIDGPRHASRTLVEQSLPE